MVGGGIFAVLGLSVQLARGGTPVAFAIAGLVALLTSYSYVKLSVRYPSRGGTVTFPGPGLWPRLLARFGQRAAMAELCGHVVPVRLCLWLLRGHLFSPAHAPLAKHVLISLAILVPTALNVASAKIIGRTEVYVVGLKLAILLFFLAVGAQGVDPARLAPSTWVPALPLVAGGMIIFRGLRGL